MRVQHPKGKDHPMYRHGMTKTSIYLRFKAMHNRCSNPNVPAYKYYGLKGIKVCERWALFENFLADMGMPGPRQTLERIDNNKGYEPSNCKWATYLEQMNNQCSNRLLTIDGRTMTVAQWARDRGVESRLIVSRLSRGWEHRDAVFLPVGKPGNYYRNMQYI